MPLPFLVAIGSAITSAFTTGSLVAGVAATTTIGTGTMIAVGTVVGGVVVTAAVLGKMEEAKTEGYKTGYESASKEYEKKLRKQAEYFRAQLESLERNNEEKKKSDDEVIRITKDIFKLCGEYEGCLERLCSESAVGEADLSEMKTTLAWLRSACEAVSTASRA